MRLNDVIVGQRYMFMPGVTCDGNEKTFPSECVVLEKGNLGYSSSFELRVDFGEVVSDLNYKAFMCRAENLACLGEPDC